MQPQFDIFKVDKNGTPLWVEAAETLDAAKTRTKELLKLDPGAEFVIFNQQTQGTISVKLDAPVEF
jgi:hypothetical protein